MIGILALKSVSVPMKSVKINIFNCSSIYLTYSNQGTIRMSIDIRLNVRQISHHISTYA